MHRLFLPVAAALLAAHPAHADSGWERVELAIPAGVKFIDPRAINEAGQVAGNYYDAQFRQRAFLREVDGTFIDLGSLGGDYVYARGLNDRGEVVGVSATAWTNPRFCWEGDGVTFCAPEAHAYVWRDGVMHDLGTRGFESTAQAINAAGEIVGGAQTSDGSFFAQRWVHDEADLFGAFGGSNSSGAMSINARGLVAGSASIDGWSHAFLWDPRTGMRDLGTLGGPYSVAVDVSDRGEVVVNSATPDIYFCETFPGGQSCVHEQRPFLWRDGTKTPLPGLGGALAEARAVNVHGQVAGTAWTTETIFCSDGRCVHRTHAVVWDDGEPVDLGDPGLSSSAGDVNDRGDVVGAVEVAPFDHRLVVWRRKSR
jgi:probable HAF family extracellular repeat protein